MPAAIYARVSTTDQDPTFQARSMRQLCELKCWRVFETYLDEGVSGADRSRPALDRMMRDARAGKFDAVVVWKFDRFARSVPHLLDALDTFRSLGIQFVSVTEGIDTTTPAGRLVYIVIAAIAEFERELIRERVKAGLENARAQGKRLGRPRVAVDVHLIAALREKAHGDGRPLSWREIAQKTGLGMGTVRRAFASLAKKPSLEPALKP